MISVKIMASPPFSVSSSPTWGPTKSTRLSSTSGSSARSTSRRFSRTSVPLTPSWGGSRTSTSRAVPKFVTSASGKSASVSTPRMRCRSAVSG